ncbi:MAG: carbohydrate ABC transporter permease [Arachnia sp.]
MIGNVPTSKAMAASTRRDGAARRGRKHSIHFDIGPWLVLPALLVLAVFVYRPLGRSLQLSFYGTDLLGQPSRFVGGENWADFVTSPDLLRTVGVSILIAVIAMVMAVSFALASALLLRSKIPGRGIFQVLFSLPFAYSAASASAVFYALFGPSVGLVNTMMAGLGLDMLPWLQKPGWAIFTVAMTTAWYESGFAFLVLIAAVKAIPDEVVEAAGLDGASSWALVRWVLIPMMWPSLFFLIVTQTITGLQTFTQVYVMTRGGPQNATTTLVFELYMTAFGSGTPDYGRASVVAIFLVAIVGAVTALQFQLSRRMNEA